MPTYDPDGFNDMMDTAGRASAKVCRANNALHGASLVSYREIAAMASVLRCLRLDRPDLLPRPKAPPKTQTKGGL